MAVHVQNGGPPEPYFKLPAFSDLIQIAVMAGTMLIAVTKLTASQEHESEMRKNLESHTVEMVADMRQRQADNTTRFEQRFTETSQRDHESLTELKQAMSRINDRLDLVSSNQAHAAQLLDYRAAHPIQENR